MSQPASSTQTDLASALAHLSLLDREVLEVETTRDQRSLAARAAVTLAKLVDALGGEKYLEEIPDLIELLETVSTRDSDEELAASGEGPSNRSVDGLACVRSIVGEEMNGGKVSTSDH
jgi:hypothetical protein